MSEEREAPDGGDMLDDVVNLDEQWFEEGYEAGQEEGRKRSLEEGKATGRAKGFEIGCELGFYEACCQAWLEKQPTSEPVASEDKERHQRLEKAVLAILELIREYPRKNSADVDFVDELQRIRAKFKAATTLMGVRLPFSLRPPAEEGLSF